MSIVFNIFSVLLTVLLVGLLILFLALSMKYIKTLTYKIGLIMWAAKHWKDNPDI